MTDKLGPYELNTVILGDCLEAMRQIPDNSIDSIICDPPYGLSKEPDMIEVLTHWLNGDDYNHRGGGFMGKDWDSFVPGPAIWRECYRVMKPGGCLMAFGGTRTVDLLSIAIRLAGFEKFDEIIWLHGQGFAKGADISKKLDEMAGIERKVVGEKPIAYPDSDCWGIPLKSGREAYREEKSGFLRPATNKGGTRFVTAPATDAAKLWDGWKTQLKPSHEVILCFWKPRDKTFAKNALKWGVAGLNIDGARIATGGELIQCQKASKDAKFTTPLTHNRPREYTAQGRYPANVLLSHHPDCVRTGTQKVKGHTAKDQRESIQDEGCYGNGRVSGLGGHAGPDGYETVESWECHPDCPIRMLDQQAGERGSNGGNGKFLQHSWMLGEIEQNIERSKGDASRFFYCPKAPGREKWFYCQICDDCYPYAEREDHAHGKPKGKRKHQIAHPTVKPLAINNYLFGVLEYLCRLTKTPTGGIVLDPFAGSGTTGIAALANGRDFILIENDPIYHKIATKRIAKAMEKPRQLELIKR